MSRAVIITSYIDEPVDLRALVSPEDHLVCLDGGYDFALAAEIVPDVLMGDFDSLESPVPEDSGIRVLRFPPEKDYTDLELAFRLIDPAEHPELLVIGGLGGRLDQTLVNMQMLSRYTARPGENAGGSSDSGADAGGSSDSGADAGGPNAFGDGGRRFARIDMVDGRNRCFVVHGNAAGDTAAGCDGTAPVTVTIPAEEGCCLSLIPLTEICGGVSLSGVKYPLAGMTLTRGASLTVSNEITDGQAVLRLGSGSVLVCLCRVR